MLKQKEYDWKDSNVALIGSDWDKDARLDSAETEKAWDGAGEKPELKIWRVEQFKIKHWKESKYGEFHTGDSYIILHTSKHPDTEKLLYDIYFWIGDESSQDEYGVAAYKTVELDAKFRDAAIQHREVQYHESAQFKAVLDSFGFELKYLEGGVESGFNKVADIPKNKKPELFRVKGAKGSIEFRKVDLRKDSLNSDDVFVLDTWDKIFQWNGKNANQHEKSRAASYLDIVVSSRGNQPKKYVFDEGEAGVSELTPDELEFWNLIPDSWKVNMGCVQIPLREYKVQEKASEEDDEVKGFRKQLYRLHEGSDKQLSFSKVGKGQKSKGNKVARELLSSNDVFLLDDGFVCWVWIGKESSSKEKGQGIAYAMSYIEKHERPNYMPIKQIRDGTESPLFSEHFHNDSKPLCLPLSF